MESTIENGRLRCEYWRLQTILGTHHTPVDGDGKVRAQWRQRLSGVGMVEVYDYKSNSPNVHTNLLWSIKAEPAVEREFVKMLNELNPTEMANREPKVTTVIGVVDWMRLDESGDHMYLPELVRTWVPNLCASHEWLGFTDHWAVLRLDDEDGTWSRFRIHNAYTGELMKVVDLREVAK